MRQILLWSVLLLWCGSASAQLVVDANYTPQQLVEDILIGQGVQVSNVQYSGNIAARGYFNGSSSNIGLASGVILSTGLVVDAVGPNSTLAGDIVQEGGADFGGSGDPALSSISGSSSGTFDAAVLEFDFVPTSDTIQFRFVFASNEYMEWVNTTAAINDIFAFFLSGPGISGEQNIARIPGTATPVSMQSVNADVNAQYYIDNGDNPGEEGAPTVSYNGFTTVLTATAIITPCQSYHIRLAIADSQDGIFDSAVFLEEGSFTSPSVSISPETNFSNSSTGYELVEGCSSMSLTFERSEPYDDAFSMDLLISGSATVGVDVTNIPSTITFPAGSATVTIDFDVIEDNLVEGTETLILELDQVSCVGGSGTVTISIEDAIPLSIQTSPDVVFTCPQEYEITVTPTGGYGSLSYNWSIPGETGPSATVFPLVSQAYTVTVTDECGFSESSTVVVNTSGYQPLEVSVNDAVVCDGELAELMAIVNGGRGAISFTWNGAAGSDLYSFSATESTTVEVVVTDDCNLSASAVGTVEVDETVASFTQELVRHNAIEFTNTTPNTETVFWAFGDSLTSMEENIIHYYDTAGTYTVVMVVVNENGCVDSVEQEVTVYPPLHVYIPNTFTPNGDGLNDMFGVFGEGFLYYDLEIFDRWGKRVVSGRFTESEAWDGTVNGRKVPRGLYAYKVWVQPPIGIEHKEADVLYVLPDQ